MYHMKFIVLAIVLICAFAAGLVLGAALALPPFDSEYDWRDDDEDLLN